MREIHIVYSGFGLVLVSLAIFAWMNHLEISTLRGQIVDSVQSQNGVTVNEESEQSIHPTALIVRLLMRDEAKRSKPYKDAKGNITIGVGRNLTTTGLSDDEIRYILQNDVKRSEASARRVFGEMWDSIGEARQASIVDVIFNVGEGNFKGFIHFIAEVKKKDWTEAAKELLDSLAAHENAKRYHRNASVILTGNERYFDL